MKTTTTYDAFISYNHNPRDMRIAKELQTRLEHYNVPKDLQTKYGTRRIERVFLDVGELGVSADLNDTIKEALNNTDYLIVISSPESKQSPWVKKEIEHFLLTHNMDRILTVISAGEPKDVLPNEVMKQEIKGDDGNVVVIDREPLSADYRNDLKKAHKEELPRLVAAIIGCRYDELVKRQRQHRMRQMIAAFGVFAVLTSSFLAYFVWTNHKIKINYNNTLIEQSKSLVVQSQDSLESGDKISAVQYALEALPSKDNDRPIVPEAVYALSNAVDVYKNPDQKRWVGTKRYDRKSSVSDFDVAELGTKTVLVELFSSGHLAIYDADSGDEICDDFTKSLSEQDIVVDNFAFTDDSSLLLVCTDSIILFDVISEKEIYNKKLEYSGVNVPVSYDETPPIADNTIWINASGYNKKDEVTDYLLSIDLSSGNLKRIVDLGNISISNIALENDGNRMAYVESRLDESDRAFIINDSQSEPVLIREMEEISDVAFDEYGNVVVCGIDSKVDEQGYANAEMAFINSTLYTIAMEKKIVVESINPEDNSKIWQMNYRKRVSGRPQLEMEFEEKAKKDKFFKAKTLCRINNILLIIDSEGTLEKELDFRSTIKELVYESDKPSAFRVILKDGQIAGYFPEEDSIVTTYNLLNNPVDRAIVIGGCIYAMRSEKSTRNNLYITKYTYGGTDPSWSDYPKENQEKDLFNSKTVDAYREYFVEVETDYEGIGKIVTRHSKTGAVVKTIDLALREGNTDDTRIAAYEYIGINNEDGKAMFITSSDDRSYVITTIDVLSGQKDEIRFENEETKAEKNGNALKSYYPLGRINSKNGVITRAVKEERHMYENNKSTEGKTFKIIQMNCNNEEFKEYEIPGISEEQMEYIGRPENSITIDSDGKRVFLEYEGKLMCYDFDGKKQWESDELSIEFKDVQYIDGNVIVSGTDGPENVICFIDPQNGKGLGRIILDDISYLSSVDNPEMLTDEKVVVVFNLKGYVIDNDSYKVISIIPNYLGYNPTTNEIAIGSDVNNYYGHIPYRSLDELIELGNNIIGKQP